MQKKLQVSIIIVNYNGRHLLDDCLQSLRAMDFPKKRYEVLLVDNNSSDDSVPYTRAHYPWVRVIVSEENIGFTGGNNLGFQQAKGEYLVLLNSDVRVEKTWLSQLVLAAKGKKVGIVSSKLRYATPFIEVSVRSKAVPRSQISNSTDHAPIGVFLEDIICEDRDLSALVYYKDGVYNRQASEVAFRRTNGNAKLYLPFPINKSSHEFTFTVHGYESMKKEAIPVEIRCGRQKYKLSVMPFQTKQLRIVLEKKSIRPYLFWLIQNAGNIVMHAGYSKDRGSLIHLRDNEVREFYETESPYFNQKTELLAACGAGCLIKRAVIDHVGAFNGYYFMYYEDVELSIRAWRAGWKILYEPKAVGYHRHRATTGADESSFFIKYIERNRIAMIIIHFPLSVVCKELLIFFVRFIITGIKSFVFQFRDNAVRSSSWRRKYDGRLAAFKSIVTSFPRIFLNRLRTDRYWPIDRKKMNQLLY